MAVMVGAACGGDDDTASGDTTTTAPDDGGGDAAAVLGPVNEASGDPVSVGFITDGANATTDQSIDLDVAAATVKYLNKHKAGIGRRPIELVTCEAKLHPATGTDCANQMVEQQVVAVVVGTTGVVEAVWTPLHDAGIATIFFAGQGAAVLADTRSTFTLSDPTAGTVGVPIAVAQANDEDKVTAVVIDVPPALAPYEGAGAQQFEDAGLDLDLVKVPPGTADMTAQLQPVIAGDPGVIHVLGNDSFCIAAFQAMQSLGFDGPVTSIAQCITDPAWYLNLTADAAATIQVKADRIPVAARTASAEEKPGLWRIMCGIWPNYDAYQARTERDIPVVVLSPSRG